ncbi:FH1/FH2 domain-containing protein 3 isoform X2 [Phlebotomus papatasi]|uniref:FH1/FH2 domain-containing protein 3 isoform X2 n=1 Tax=Phlebotomus papatasi TaxID=29031 RepID=UPI0024836F9E|nr:FH1/FH2 domain-containing protein 3 isoform X2 [Phlebotomus papatasi]
MSTYRNYFPWKSNYSSYSSKYGSRFTSSRDDVSSETKTSSTATPKFGSLASPTTYRPSYSGGTYRSVPIKKEPVTTTYSRYGGKETKEPDRSTKDKEPDSPKKSTTVASKYGSTKDLPSASTRSYAGGSTKDLSSTARSYSGASTGNLKSNYPSTSSLADTSKTSRYPSSKDLTSSTDKGPTSKYSSNHKSEKKNDGPPVTFNTRYGSTLKVPRERSRDPSPSVSSSLGVSRFLKPGDRSRDPSPNVSKTAPKYGRTSRDPSPVSPSVAISRVRSRDPSPVDRPAPTLLRRSRDPSPIDQLKDRFGSTSSGYSPNSFSGSRLYTRGSSSTTYPKFSSSSRSAIGDSALSYMTHNEARACTTVSRKFKEKTPPSKIETESPVKDSEKPNEEEDIVMIQVTMITRSTSPNPQSSTSNYLKARREIAKTVEKTIERPLKRPQMIDKEIQSDRLDDPTKNVRVSATRVSSSVPWSSYLDTKYSPSTGSSRYSTSNSVSPSKSSASTSTKEKSEESDKKEEKAKTKRSSISKSSDKSKSPSSEKSKTPSSKSSKSKSPESSKSLPPPVPGKAESPTKTPGCMKWANKDFRKSALNMGPADQPRKSRSSSSPVDSAERLERSPSCSSSSSLSNADAVDSRNIRESSRGSLLATSADELSMDRPTSRSESVDVVSSKNEEAKSFLIRALGPVSLLNSKTPSSQLSPEKPNWSVDSATSDTPDSLRQEAELVRTESSSVGDTMKYRLRHIDSGEKAWWLNNSEGESGQEKRDESPKIQYKIRHIESGEKAWWMLSENSTDADKIRMQQRSSSEAKSDTPNPKYKIRHIESGERAWWLGPESPKHQIFQPQPKKSPVMQEESSEDEEVVKADHPLGDRASPEGLESTRNHSPYDNVPQKPRKSPRSLFISRHTNIDDLLGASPIMMAERFSARDVFEEISPSQVRIHDSTPQMPVIQRNGEVRENSWSATSGGQNHLLDDAAVQVYKDGDYGAYLDLESSLAEQSEDIDGLQSGRKNSLVVRTQLSVRVHAIIEKLLSSEGRELRRALFSLKQIFQEDKDLVHGFVALGGLNCLVRVGSGADQNYQNYILRALGQVMLYVDGMNGVMKNGPTVQWLYSLIASKYRLVVKTALKLLLVFVEYVESNCYLLVNAIHTVDSARGSLPWSNIMRLLKDYENADTELLIYATSLINKTLSGLSDQDSFYDESDFLEQQGMEGVIQRYMSRPGTDLDLLDQLQLYEAVLKFEDGETDGIRIPDNSVRKTLRYRATDSAERRKSRRHSTGNTPAPPVPPLPHNLTMPPGQTLDEDSSSSQNSTELNCVFRECRDKTPREGAGVTPGLRRRRERAERQKSFMREQQDAANRLTNGNSGEENGHGLVTAVPVRLQTHPSPLVVIRGGGGGNMSYRLTNGFSGYPKVLPDASSPQHRLFETESNRLNHFYNQLTTIKNGGHVNGHKPTPPAHDPAAESDVNDEKKLLLQLKRDHTVKDLTQKLSNLPISPQEEKPQNRIGDMSGLISKAKEGLAKSKSRGDISRSPSVDQDFKKQSPEPKKSENELHWEELVRNMSRPLNLCDLDFTDLGSEDEKDVLAPRGLGGTIPPPPPPLGMPPPILPPPTNLVPPPIMFLNGPAKCNGDAVPGVKKTKKTVKLFWKEVREDMIPAIVGRTVWDELPPTKVDTDKLEHLFESRAKDLMTKKQQEMNKNKEIIVLDHKRSNAINIAMTKLPPPRAIKAAILKMDATVVTREGIDKLLNMLPTEEERGKIQEAQMINPELPLGNAEQFLLTLSSISELAARLKLWAFKLDFEISEKEIAEPLMDLKQGLELLKANKTFKCILSTLLEVGIFLNGQPVKGFQIEYLAKVPEVKDTVHKHSLLHHLCHMVMEASPDTTDLYSEIGPITRASKADFAELAHSIVHLEQECKASWDRLKLISKHDCPPHLKQKLVDFLADCAERIIILDIVHRRVINRYRKFLMWLGIPQHRVAESKPNDFCRIVSEFALEYRTTRERVQQQIEKKANHRERNKTRGKMIIDVGKFKTQEDRADAELRQLLGSPMTTVDTPDPGNPFTWRRRRPENLHSPKTINRDEQFTDGDDEILESLVKTATKAPGTRSTPRERKRTRHADRKSLKRSRTREGFTVERTGASPEL